MIAGFSTTELLLVFWIIAAVMILAGQKTYRLIVFFTVFSLITSLIYLFLGAPDVAMAEAGISSFATIFLIICVEKYYHRGGVVEEVAEEVVKKRFTILKYAPALVFSALLLVLFMWFVPSSYAFLELRDLYLSKFMIDIGGENAVTAIYLGYRVYDTLFEALLLVIAAVAVIHISWYDKSTISFERHSEIETSRMARFTLRIICPIIILFGIYLIMNGHISAGGGFLGGLALAAFFVCRFLVRGIYDIPVKKVMKIEELTFIGIVVFPMLAIFAGLLYISYEWTPLFQTIYLIAMNAFVGMKVACGFFVIFYRTIAVEGMPVTDNLQSPQEG